MWEGVGLSIIAQTIRFFDAHEVESIGREGNKHNFHGKQIEAFPS